MNISGWSLYNLSRTTVDEVYAPWMFNGSHDVQAANLRDKERANLNDIPELALDKTFTRKYKRIVRHSGGRRKVR